MDTYDLLVRLMAGPASRVVPPNRTHSVVLRDLRREDGVPAPAGEGGAPARQGPVRGGRQRRRMRKGRMTHPPFPLQLRQLRCVVRHGGAPDLSQRPRLRPPPADGWGCPAPAATSLHAAPPPSLASTQRGAPPHARARPLPPRDAAAGHAPRRLAVSKATRDQSGCGGPGAPGLRWPGNTDLSELVL